MHPIWRNKHKWRCLCNFLVCWVEPLECVVFFLLGFLLILSLSLSYSGEICRVWPWLLELCQLLISPETNNWGKPLPAWWFQVRSQHSFQPHHRKCNFFIMLFENANNLWSSMLNKRSHLHIFSFNFLPSNSHLCVCLLLFKWQRRRCGDTRGQCPKAHNKGRMWSLKEKKSHQIKHLMRNKS